jgi:hypothetical protein
MKEPERTDAAKLMREAHHLAYVGYPPEPWEQATLGEQNGRLAAVDALVKCLAERPEQEPQGAPEYPSYCKVTGYVFPCGCASCDVLSKSQGAPGIDPLPTPHAIPEVRILHKGTPIPSWRYRCPDCQQFWQPGFGSCSMKRCQSCTEAG